MTNPIPPITGEDGFPPVYDPEGRWTIWALHEIYDGTQGQNRFVPKISDYVREVNTFTTYIVESLDPVTLIPTLREIRPANMSFSFSDTDILFGVGPGTAADTYRVYIDKTVTPFKLTVDQRLYINGSMSEYYKVFKGPVADNNVISRLYDNNGTFLSDSIPLEMASINNITNIATKSARPCSTIEDLVDNEIVTLVAYSDEGHVVSQRQLLVTETSFIRSLNDSAKYVSHISLSSPFLSPTNDHLIEFPINVPINALNVIGTVWYTDGSSVDYPANGNKFSLFGLDEYTSTIVGQQVPLALRYLLSEDESAIVGVTTDGHSVVEPYTLRTVNSNNSYTVKLFGYPVWVDVNNGYTIEWWLYNLDRNVIFNVTPFVIFDTNTGAFNPKGYGVLQRRSVSINLRDVSGSFQPYTHVQLFDVTLYGDPNNLETPWTVNHVSNDSLPAYGIQLHATKIATQTINISSSINDFDEWKERLYTNIRPLLDRDVEINVPNPTHITVMYKNFETTLPITSWDQDIAVGVTVDVFSSVKIKFIKRTISGDMQLGISYLTVKLP